MRALSRTIFLEPHLRLVCQHTQRAADACKAASLARDSRARPRCQCLSRGARLLSASAQQPDMGPQSLHSALSTYWGFSAFRSCQEDVIRSVLDGHDNLVVMVRLLTGRCRLRRPMRAHPRCTRAGDGCRQVDVLPDTRAGHPAALHCHLAAHLPYAGPGALHACAQPHQQPVQLRSLLRLHPRRCWR